MGRMKRSLALLSATLVAAATSNCSCDPVIPPSGEICGSGTVDAAPFALDATRSRFIIVVDRNEGGACGVFHSHVVNAGAVLGEFSVVAADPGASTMKITVAAAALDPDDPELRLEFLPEGKNFALSDGDRSSIRGSVLEEVKGGEFPTLVFTVAGMTTTDGDGEATLTSEIAGGTSDVPTSYTVSKEGDAHLISGTATLDGAPFGIPRNALGICVNPIMAIHYELALVPGEVECEGLGNAPVYAPTLFPDDACAEDVSYNEVRDVAVRRCAGCHAEELRLGATVPLVEFDDWRTDSIRNQGRPLYETAFDFVHLDPAEGLSMPPQPTEGDILATDLTPDEVAIFDAWVEGGARNTKCADDPGVSDIGPRIAPETTCSDEFNQGDGVDDDADGFGDNSARNFFEFNCAYCHVDATNFYAGIPQVAQLDGDNAVIPDPITGNGLIDFDLGASAMFHPYYIDDTGQRASFWQASLARVADFSMPPVGAGFEGDLSFDAFETWVNNGSPPPCP